MMFTTKTEYGLRAMVALARNQKAGQAKVGGSKTDGKVKTGRGGVRGAKNSARSRAIEPLSLAQIAKSEHISQAYLERLFRRLKADGLVKSSQGKTGGYLLARPAEKISVFDIVEALEGAVAVFYCISEDEKKVSCQSKKCLTKKVWQELQKNIIKTLRGFTLKNLV